jgi:hypothetical protein
MKNIDTTDNLERDLQCNDNLSSVYIFLKILKFVFLYDFLVFSTCQKERSYQLYFFDKRVGFETLIL